MIVVKIVAIVLILLHLVSVMSLPTTVGKERKPITENVAMAGGVIAMLNILILLVLVVSV